MMSKDHVFTWYSNESGKASERKIALRFEESTNAIIMQDKTSKEVS